MSLLVDVREVPWRILETVQARILANRERMKRRAQAEKVRGLTRPRQQQRSIGATMSAYRRPEPCPLVLGGDPAWLLIPNGPEFKPVVRGIKPFELIPTEPDVALEYGAAAGPEGTGAFVEVSGPPEEFSNGELKLNDSTTDQANPRRLKEPASKAYTLELMFKVPPPYTSTMPEYSGESATGAVSITELGWFVIVRNYIGEASPEESDAYVSLRMELPYDPLFAQVSLGSVQTFDPGGGAVFDVVDSALGNPGWQHAAIVQTPNASQPDKRDFSFYWGGKRLKRYENHEPHLWDQMPPDNFTPLNMQIAGNHVDRRVSLHGIRYSPRALYTGDTYTPPTSITRLA